MTKNEAQKFAPSYLHLPDDGAPFTCSECKLPFHHTKVRLCFTPARPGAPRLLCLDCVDEWWLANARDCGTVTG